jgi:type II secretory pathway component PulF
VCIRAQPLIELVFIVIRMAATSLASQSLLWRTIARLWRAGISPVLIGEQLRATTSDPMAHRLGHALIDGRSLADGLRACIGLDVAPVTIEVIDAAERSGRVPEVLDQIADSADAARALSRRALAKAAYPLLVFHVAMFVRLPAALLSGNLGTLVVPTLITLAVDTLLVLTYRWLWLDTASVVVDRIALAVPQLGSIRTSADLRSYLDTTNHLYEAGIGLPDALRKAAETLRRPALRARLGRALHDLPPEADPFAHMPVAFPSHADAFGLLRTGFQTGDLSGSLRQLTRVLADAETERSNRFIGLVGGGLFAAAAIVVAITAIRFYGALFAGLR